jgi:hypothetical protein
MVKYRAEGAHAWQYANPRSLAAIDSITARQRIQQKSQQPGQKLLNTAEEASNLELLGRQGDTGMKRKGARPGVCASSKAHKKGRVME